MKVRLTDNAEAWDAMRILADWRRLKQQATHLPRAIRLYAALLKRDIAVLDEYFPYLTEALGNRGGQPARRMIPASAPEITYAQRSEADDESDLLGSLGLDGVEF